VIDLHNVDWARLLIPGGWFTGPPTVQLQPDPDFPSVGVATVRTSLNGGERDIVNLGEDGPVNVTYGRLGGRHVAVAPVFIENAAGGRDPNRGTGLLVYRAGLRGPVLMRVLYSEARRPAVWLRKGHRALHVDTVDGISLAGGALTIHSWYYGYRHFRAGPVGSAVTTWSNTNGQWSFSVHYE
jgi:hypothetical protein